MASPTVTPLTGNPFPKLTLRQDETLESIALAISIITALSTTYTCLKYGYKAVRRQPRSLPKMKLLLQTTFAIGCATPFVWQRYRIHVLWQADLTRPATPAQNIQSAIVASKTHSFMVHSFAPNMNVEPRRHLVIAVPMTYYDQTKNNLNPDANPLSYAQKIKLAYSTLPKSLRDSSVVTLYMPQLEVKNKSGQFQARILPIEAQAQAIGDLMQSILENVDATMRANTHFIYPDTTCYIDPKLMSQVLNEPPKDKLDPAQSGGVKKKIITPPSIHFIPGNLNQYHASQLKVFFLDKLAQRGNPPVSKRVADLIGGVSKKQAERIRYYDYRRPSKIAKENFKEARSSEHFNTVLESIFTPKKAK